MHEHEEHDERDGRDQPESDARDERERDMLAARYGRTRARRTRDRMLLVAGAVVLAAVVVAWAVWTGIGSQEPTVEATDTGFRLLNEERTVEVSWTLSVVPGNATACIVKALDEDFTIVGWRVIELPASDRRLREFTESVRVARDATTGLISRCWLT